MVRKFICTALIVLLIITQFSTFTYAFIKGSGESPAGSGLDTEQVQKTAVNATQSASDFVVKDGVLEYYIGRQTDIVIPDSLGISTIGQGLFAYNNKITSVIIPDGVKSIEYGAFSSCPNLSSVTIPDSVTQIGTDAFSSDTNLKSIKLPDGITVIDRQTFALSGLTSVTIPDKVTEIAFEAFSGCSELTSVIMHEGITKIDEGAFQYCPKLTDAKIPSSVTTIGNKAFLKADLQDPIFMNNGATLCYVPYSYTSYVIPDSVTTIQDDALKYNAKLASITFGKGINSISATLLAQSETIQSITIPDNVTDIGPYAFSFCTNLKTVILPNGITTIKEGTFAECQNLTSIMIPSSVTSIQNLTFTYFARLTIYGEPGSYAQSYAEQNNIKFIDINQGPIPEPTPVPNFEVTDGVLTKYNGTEANVVIPDGVTAIGDNAFQNKFSIKSVTIPDSVTSIGSNAFYLCNSLETINIPESVTTVGDGVFYSCGSLTAINIPGCIKSISNEMFFGCNRLTSVVLENGVETIGMGAFSNCTNLKSVSLPDTVTTIRAYAFNHCDKLTDMTIPESVTTIEDSAFSYSSLPDPIFTDGGKTLYYVPMSFESYDVPGTVTKLGKSVFAGNTNLTKITLPSGLTTIDTGAFAGCANLSSVIIPDNVTYIGPSAFFTCTSLSSITIPDTITSIESYTFEGCYSLTSFTIPPSVTSIGKGAFHLCSGLTYLVIPDTVKSIDTDAFWLCSDDFTLYGNEGSYAQTYAAENDIPFTYFPDIQNVSWAQDAILNLAGTGIINGYDDGTFKPENNITRAEFIKLLVAAFGKYTAGETTTYTDCSPDKWYYSYVASAEKAELTNGTGNGLFSPEAMISREEVFTFCARALEMNYGYDILTDEAQINQQLAEFADGSSVSTWARGYVASTIIWGLVKGSDSKEGKIILPRNPITRAETAVVMNRIISGTLV